MDHKRVIDELTQGMKFAKQFQIHLNTPSSSQETQEILIQNILNSFDKSLSLLTATGDNANGSNQESHLYPGMGITRLESPCSFGLSPPSEDSDPDFKDLSTKGNNNGNAEKWKHQVKVRAETGFEEALDDGYSWRKYGQKDILGAKHPRGYYRCTYRQEQGCFATKQVQRIDDDPTIFDITYRGRHTCNPGSLTVSPLPPPPPREIQQPSQQNQLLQSSEIPFNFQTSLNVTTENIDNPPFHFLSKSNNNFIFPTLENPYQGNMSPSFISPTTSGSTYCMVSQPRTSRVEGSPSVVVAESKLNDVVSIATSSTSSSTVDLGLTFSELEMCNNFSFDDSLFFD